MAKCGSKGKMDSKKHEKKESKKFESREREGMKCGGKVKKFKK